VEKTVCLWDRQPSWEHDVRERWSSPLPLG
jgi:hypothetical protein